MPPLSRDLSTWHQFRSIKVTRGHDADCTKIQTCRTLFAGERILRLAGIDAVAPFGARVYPEDFEY